MEGKALFRVEKGSGADIELEIVSKVEKAELGMDKNFLTDVLIIGGGVTGTGLARDLSFRGISCIVVEQDTINSGASGRNHGLLHSGARYVATDPHAAMECKRESDILKQIAPHCIEKTGGIFAALPGDDEDYINKFSARCNAAGIPCEKLEIKEALELEPALSDKIIAAYKVEDASVDPFHISLENMNQAVENGARYFNRCQVTEFQITDNSIQTVSARDQAKDRIFKIQAGMVVNAAGAWSGQICGLADIPMDMIYSKGSLLITHSRIADPVINRLRPPGDGDILVPGGTVSIFGTTSIRVNSADEIIPSVRESDILVQQGMELVPSLSTARYIRAYAGVRPLVRSAGSNHTDDDRCVSRGMVLLDHENDGVDNFFTITGGKMTTFRLMAEKTADLVAAKLKNTKKCQTAIRSLESSAPSQMTEAGMSLKFKEKLNLKNDITMCECEMISKGQFKVLIDWLKKNKKQADLNTLRVHSRLGKGACQGTFCSQRVTAFMYDEDYFKADQGLHNIKDLLHERFKGQRPVLWDGQMAQAELCEALYCGFYGLDQKK